MTIPSHGDSAALVSQDQSLYVLQQVIDGVEVRVGQLQALEMGLGGR